MFIIVKTATVKVHDFFCVTGAYGPYDDKKTATDELRAKGYIPLVPDENAKCFKENRRDPDAARFTVLEVEQLP